MTERIKAQQELLVETQALIEKHSGSITDQEEIRRLTARIESERAEFARRFGPKTEEPPSRGRR